MHALTCVCFTKPIISDLGALRLKKTSVKFSTTDRFVKNY